MSRCLQLLKMLLWGGCIYNQLHLEIYFLWAQSCNEL